MARPARVDVLRSVRRFCLDCQGESAPAVRQCTDRQCALWPWRLLNTAGAGDEAHTSAHAPAQAPAQAGGVEDTVETAPSASAEAAAASAEAAAASAEAAAASAEAAAASAEAAAASAEAAAASAEAAAASAEAAAASAEAAAASAEAAALRRNVARQALRAVRCHCMQCAGDRREVRACVAREHCILWSLRFGVRPETYKAVRQRFFAPKRLSLL